MLSGGAALDLNAVQPKPCKWISDNTWLNLVQLSNLRQFQYLLNQITNNEKNWKLWFDKEAPEEEVFPDGYQNLDVFKRLLLIRYPPLVFLKSTTSTATIIIIMSFETGPGVQIE